MASVGRRPTVEIKKQPVYIKRHTPNEFHWMKLNKIRETEKSTISWAIGPWRLHKMKESVWSVWTSTSSSQKRNVDVYIFLFLRRSNIAMGNFLRKFHRLAPLLCSCVATQSPSLIKSNKTENKKKRNEKLAKLLVMNFRNGDWEKREKNHINASTSLNYSQKYMTLDEHVPHRYQILSLGKRRSCEMMFSFLADYL